MPIIGRRTKKSSPKIISTSALVLSILTVYSSKDNAFYTRREGDINVIGRT